MQRVTHEQLQALIQLGFIAPDAEITYHRNKPVEMVNVPTLHEASDWLRDTHGLHVYVRYTDNIGQLERVIQDLRNLPSITLYSSLTYTAYPSALSAAITHALTIVKERIKQKI